MTNLIFKIGGKKYERHSQSETHCDHCAFSSERGFCEREKARMMPACVSGKGMYIFKELNNAK